MHLVLDDKFFQSFWPSVFAGTIAGILSALIFAMVLSLFTDTFNNTKLDVGLLVKTGTQRRRVFEFYIINTGKKGLTVNEVHWSIYFEAIYKIDDDYINSHSLTIHQEISAGKEWNVIEGVASSFCLPGSTSTLCIIPITLEDPFPYEDYYKPPFYYTISTSLGTNKINWFNRFWQPPFSQKTTSLNKLFTKIKKIDF